MIDRTPALALCVPLALACWAAPFAAAAQSLCTSDGRPRPQAVLERFVNADCESCWSDEATPRAAHGELALDWIVPGTRGDDAPLSAAAAPEALERLGSLHRKVPAQADSVRSQVSKPAAGVRVAQGEPVNDYIGASIELRPRSAGTWRGWLLLVEELPAGAEGSPVPRNLVRNVFRSEWHARKPLRLEDARPMQIHEGTRASRLRVVALVEDGRGRLRGVARTECTKP
jgi:hypothetical protein